MDWQIGLKGQRWDWESGHAEERYELTPSKVELVDGKLFWNDEQRLLMLGLLLENLGIEAAMTLGDPAVWRAGAARLPEAG